MKLPWVYKKNRDNSSRYVLGTVGENSFVCFGINPSTAEPDNLDPTLKSVERIAHRHDFPTWIMLNIYPQRATNPNDMHTEHERTLHRNNLKHIEQVFADGHTTILAAWGTLIEKRPYLQQCLRDIYKISKKYDANWYCIGKISKKGHPHHPLYLSNEERIKPFDIHHYIENIL
jgi:hypothetical protein